jgi:hypothetical protein
MSVSGSSEREKMASVSDSSDVSDSSEREKVALFLLLPLLPPWRSRKLVLKSPNSGLRNIKWSSS